MISLIATLLLALAPGVHERNAFRYADAITSATDDPNEIVALSVTAVRESRLSLGCPIGVGGAGGFQLNPEFFPMPVACGPLRRQATEALGILRRAGSMSPFSRAAGRYLGARSTHPEARRREELFVLAKSMLDCRCSRML